jgi:hypothetical protein
LSLMQDTIPCIDRAARNRVPYRVRAILLDSDQLGQSAERDREGLQLANAYRVMVIWQRHEHESFLLRHLDSCGQLRPGRGDGPTQLKRWIAHYEKPFDADQIAKVLDIAALRRAVQVEVDLQRFLRILGWTP